MAGRRTRRERTSVTKAVKSSATSLSCWFTTWASWVLVLFFRHRLPSNLKCKSIFILLECGMHFRTPSTPLPLRTPLPQNTPRPRSPSSLPVPRQRPRKRNDYLIMMIGISLLYSQYQWVFIGTSVPITVLTLSNFFVFIIFIFKE